MADAQPRRRLALGAIWVGGTVLAMAASILAINVAGTKVTSPASYSTAHVGQAADISGAASTVGVASGNGSIAGDAATTAPSNGAVPAGHASASGAAPTGSAASGSGGPGSPGSDGPSGPRPGGDTPGESTPTDPSSPPSTTSPVTTEAPPPSSVQAVTVTGGSVRVQCIGDTATLLADPPTSGFQAEASQPSASSTHVEFTDGNVSSEVDRGVRPRDHHLPNRDLHRRLIRTPAHPTTESVVGCADDWSVTMLAAAVSPVLAVNPVTWARSQMAFTLAAHIILVPLGVSWACFTLIANYKAIRHDDPAALDLAQRWSKYMAVTFAVAR